MVRTFRHKNESPFAATAPLMNPEAIEQANSRLQRAKTALTVLQDKTATVAELRMAWSDFLLAAAGLYSKLEQGSKDSPKSQSWFGRVKHIRRSDPLMRYLHHARNSDEHSLDITASMGTTAVSTHESVTVSTNPDGTPNVRVDMSKVDRHDPSGPVMARITVDIYPRAVTDNRYGDTFQPPKEHLNTAMADTSAPGIAELAVEYLGSLINEAEELAR